MSGGHTIVFSSDIDDPAEWDLAVKALRPDVAVVDWRAVEDPAACDFALMFTPPPGGLAPYTGLKGLQVLGAGINQLGIERLPPDLPLARLIDTTLTETMVDYALAAVLRHFRSFDVYERQTRERRWEFAPAPLRSSSPVGVMGLGVLGGAVASAFAGLGFPVHGWARSPREIPGVTVHAGEAELGTFLASARAFVCVLPLTPATRGVLDRAAFAAMPAGSVVVNIGRGAHVVEADLVAAIEAGHIAGATLDVFDTEPLPPGHPFYGRPEILVTPHVAGGITPQSAAPTVLENMDRALAGRPLVNAVDRTAGY